jgi:signal transduction histidine kinase
LRASRQRLVLAADTDRRTIERDLHEGPQQHLVALAVNLQLARQLADTDPAAAKALLDELQREARRALTEMRELANRIFPPLLEAGGLVAELRAAASRAGVQARIDVDIDAPSPPEIAGAIYFCALEAFERAPVGTPVVVRVRSEERALAFEIEAEGDLGSERRAPHDHVEALGGQVTITAEGDRTTVAGSLSLSR